MFRARTIEGVADGLTVLDGEGVVPERVGEALGVGFGGEAVDEGEGDVVGEGDGEAVGVGVGWGVWPWFASVLAAK